MNIDSKVKIFPTLGTQWLYKNYSYSLKNANLSTGN